MQIQSNLGKNTEIKFWFNRKNMELSQIYLAVLQKVAENEAS